MLEICPMKKFSNSSKPPLNCSLLALQPFGTPKLTPLSQLLFHSKDQQKVSLDVADMTKSAHQQLIAFL